MERESSHPTSGERTRYLNIVYFIESARSHTIRINLAHARWAVGGAILVFTWAIGSIFWITSLRLQISAARDRLETSLTTIFDYQIKNDQVFDIAYPTDATNSYYSEAAQLASNSPIVEKTGDKTVEKAIPKVPVETNNTKAAVAISDKIPAQPTEKVAAGALEKPIEKSPEKLAEKAPEKPALAASSQPAVAAETTHNTDLAHSNAAAEAAASKLIDISNAKISKNGSKYSLVFDINNLSKQKAEGYIWTVASFTSDSGQTALSAAPEHTKINSGTGEIVSIKSAYRFSIQRFKNKVFDFRTPAGKEWKLSALKIHFADVAGNSADAVDIPVDQAINSANGNQAESH
jgi:hypothetical protein